MHGYPVSFSQTPHPFLGQLAQPASYALSSGSKTTSANLFSENAWSEVSEAKPFALVVDDARIWLT